MDPLADRVAAPDPDEGRVNGRFTARALLVVFLTFWAQFAWVKATNFDGFDEWLLLSLSSRGIVSAPHANRPWQFIWHLPAAAVDPFSLVVSWLLHGTYMALSACLVVLIVRRLLPAQPVLALLAGTLAATWAPLDPLRLTTVYTVSHAGTTFGITLAVFLLIEAYRRGSTSLLALACLMAFVTCRGYEAALPVLAGAPLLPLLLLPPRPRRWRLVVAWAATIVTAGALAVAPLVSGDNAQLYQRTIKPLDTNPIHFATRMVEQYGHHLGPAFAAPRLPLPASALVAFVFIALSWLALRGVPRGDWMQRRPLLVAIAVGLCEAGLGYSALVLGTIRDPGRAQFFSAPGVGVALAAAVLLLASWAPAAVRRGLAMALAAFLVANGTGWVVRNQANWDEVSKFAPQRRVLRGIVRWAPDLRAHTLVLLVDSSPAWDATFGFRHAIELMYDGHATGYVLNRPSVFYHARFDATGIRCEPEPIIRGAWRSPVTQHTFSEIVIFAADPLASVHLVEAWPDTLLPPLPPGARYDPRSRFLPLEGAAPRARKIIE